MTDLIPLHLNESPYPPLPSVASALQGWINEANRYPEFLPNALRSVVADFVGVGSDRVSMGAGATGLAYQVLQAFCGPGERFLTSTPTFDGYPILADLAGVGVDAVPLRPDGGTDLPAMAAAIGARTRVIVLCSPHNPTGSVIGEDELHRFLQQVGEERIVVLDQAYFEFADSGPDIHRLLRCYPNLLILRTFSKAHGLAALRAGYAIGAASTIERVRHYEVPFGIGSAAGVAVPVALAATDELATRVHAVRTERTRLQAALVDLGIETLPSQANHVFVRTVVPVDLASVLRGGGVAAKVYGGAEGLTGVRITVADRAATDSVVRALSLVRQMSA